MWVKFLIHSQTSSVAVWKWISNFIPHFTTCNYLCMDGLKLIHVNKRYPMCPRMEPIYFLGDRRFISSQAYGWYTSCVPNNDSSSSLHVAVFVYSWNITVVQRLPTKTVLWNSTQSAFDKDKQLLRKIWIWWPWPFNYDELHKIGKVNHI